MVDRVLVSFVLLSLSLLPRLQSRAADGGFVEVEAQGAAVDIETCARMSVRWRSEILEKRRERVDDGRIEGGTREGMACVHNMVLLSILS